MVSVSKCLVWDILVFMYLGTLLYSTQLDWIGLMVCLSYALWMLQLETGTPIVFFFSTKSSEYCLSSSHFPEGFNNFSPWKVLTGITTFRRIQQLILLLYFLMYSEQCNWWLTSEFCSSRKQVMNFLIL